MGTPPSFQSPAPAPWWKGRHGRARITTTNTARRGGIGRPERARISPHARHVRKKGGHHGRAGITTRGRSHGRMGRARISTPPPPPWRKGKGGAVPDPPQRQRAAGEGTPRTRRITTTSTRRRGGRDAMDALDHTSTRAASHGGRGRPGRVGSPQRQHGTGTPSRPLLPPVLIYLFVFPSALLALASTN